MRRTAWAFIIGVMLGALALSIAALVFRPLAESPLWLFISLAVLVTLQRVIRIIAPGNKVYESSTIGLFAAALLLPAWQFVLVVVVAHLLEWIKERLAHSNNLRAWYIQPFNIAKCVIAGLAARALVDRLSSGVWADDAALHIVAIVLGIAVYVGVNQLLLGLALRLARGVSFRDAGIWRDALMMEAPLACIGYVAVVLLNNSPPAVLFVLAPIALIYQAFMLPKTQDEAMKALEVINRDLATANQSILRLNDELFMTVAKVFDARDPYVGGHAAQVAAYAVAVAEQLGLPTARIEIVRQSGYLHDIGKIAIPEAILHKPARLTELEYDFVKRHTDIGADLVVNSKGLGHLAPFIRYHHERWDGQGYPVGLAGNAIPLEARILNLCDSVEAMASDRPYHRARTAQQIMIELQQCAETQFDPSVVKAFLSVVERRGPAFIVNSARGIAAQYSSGLLASEAFGGRSFAEIYGYRMEKLEPPHAEDSGLRG